MKETKAKTRKLLSIGGSAAVTIPPEFLRKTGLRPGDRVGLIYNSILIIVTPQLPSKEH